jgi:peptidyl-prolyl cis-trans isomerase-like 4
LKENEQLLKMAVPIAELESEKQSAALAKETQSNSTKDIDEGGHDAEKEKSRAGQDGEDVEDAEDIAERERRRVEARAQALTLEMIGDLPSAEVKPPENVLFVCKLNPVTQGKFQILDTWFQA